MPKKRLHSEFWEWFALNAEQIVPDHANAGVLSILDKKVTELNTKFSWEVGPGKDKLWQFVLSPNLDKDLLVRTRRIVAVAPDIADWEFHATRQRKEWDYQFDLVNENSGASLHISAKAWSFVLLKYPDGLQEVLLTGVIPQMTPEQRWQAAAIVLESILGEDLLLEKVDEFDLVSELEPRFAARQRSIHGLLHAVLG